MDLLPDDMLSNILGRLPPFSLAASRCVLKKWCAIIDGQRLLRADLLPLRLDGFFFRTEFTYCEMHFFSRPSTGRRISGRLAEYVEYDDVVDHCNGLLLLLDRVANPATRQSVGLPPFPDCDAYEGFFRSQYFLAYDPFVSPQHYQVVLIPLVPAEHHCSSIKFKEESEWPPSTFTMHIFSSTKWRWEERSFVREGKPAGTIADMHSEYDSGCRLHAVYIRGALYVHCQNDSIMRITLCNDNKYQMIKSPAENNNPQGLLIDKYQRQTYLGKSEKGVYFAVLSQSYTWEPYEWPRFRVWLLKESCGQMVWVLKSDTMLQAMVDNFCIESYGTPWIVNYNENEAYAVSEEWYQDDESEWDFDSGIVLPEAENKVATYHRRMEVLGFHPYKEIVFFLNAWRVVSYHLNSSKVRDLGPLCEPIDCSFPYTACWMREVLSEEKIAC